MKAIIVLTVASALSPVTLIPDGIPVLGYPDDLLIVPSGIALAVHMVPAGVPDEYRSRAETELRDPDTYRRVGFFIAAAIWCIVILLLLKFLLRAL